jgi:hypothetical protein
LGKAVNGEGDLPDVRRKSGIAFREGNGSNRHYLSSRCRREMGGFMGLNWQFASQRAQCALDESVKSRQKQSVLVK